MPEHLTMKRKVGFTLIELLTVIAIIAVLAAILVPVFARAKVSAFRSADISNMNSLRTALQQYRVDQGGYPPALLGYVTLYASGPNIGQVIPANQIQGFLYPKRANSIETFRPSQNRVGNELTTNARWPGIGANPGNCAAQAFDANTAGFVANVSRTNGDPTPTNVAADALNFYQVSGYDVANAFGPGGTRRWELRYALFWTGYGQGAAGCTLGNAADSPRQLGYEDPPETTVITWNSYFREGSTVPPARTKNDIVLFLGGAARPMDSRNVYEQAWNLNP